ncbi:UDP-glucose 4-epimerase family protein [Zobellella denitrificans]
MSYSLLQMSIESVSMGEMSVHILVTGVNGFVGAHLFRELTVRRTFDVAGTVRKITGGDTTFIDSGAIDINTNWSAAVTGKQVVIHCAARAHIIKDEVKDPLAEYRKVNVDGTLNLARQAVIAGVKRFIFISSVGVNGNINIHPFTEDGQPNPADLYAHSKWEAEQGLQQLACETEMELVVIRPPLVYGPDAPGNFGRLVRWVEKGLPLPLGAVHNKRSLVALDNLVDLIITCIDHPAAANQVFLAGDGEDLSTTELLRGVARAMGKPARLIPVPAGLLQFGATVLGKKAMAQRLLGSLQVDISKARELLGWNPPLTVEEGLKRCFETKKD